MTLPDVDAGTALSTDRVDALRYDGHRISPFEVGGQMLARVPTGSRVLDIGCGTGSLAVLLRDERSADVVGLEPHPERCALARKRGLAVHNRVFDRSLVDEVGQFDVVILADVLEHLADPGALLMAVQVAMSPHGLLLASVPNVAHWSVRSSLLRGNFDYAAFGIMDATHLRWFTRKSFEALLRTSGFAIESMTSTVGAELPAYSSTWPWRVMSVERRRRWLWRCVAAAPALGSCQYVAAARIAASAS